MERKMQSGKKGLSAFLFILLILTLPSVVNAAEIAWSPEAPLITDSAATDRSPCVEQIIQGTNKTIWVVWSSNRTGNYDIWYKTSSDGGVNWSNDTQLTTYQYKDEYPSIMQTANGSIWVVWTRETWTPDYDRDIFYKTSDDGGDTWSNKTQLTEDPDFDLCPSITETSDDNILVVWQSDRIWVWDPIASENVPQDDLYYKNSTNGGVTWSDDIRLTTEMIIVNETAEESTIVNDRDPSVTQTSDGKIWVVWVSNRYEYRHLFYKTSSDGGATWSNETQQLTTDANHNLAPSITQTTNGTILVAWHSQREGNYDIYYKTSDDGGANWSNERRLTTDAGFDEAPSITQTADGRIWIVWVSNRAGNYDIWYTTSILNVVHDIAITAVTPNSTTVFRGETVSIEVAVTNEGNGSETFNITVYADENETVIGDEINVGTQTTTNLAPYNSTTLTFNWSTTDVSPSNYTISAYAWPVQDETDLTDNLRTNGVIQIRRLLGDLDYDADVDEYDWMLFIGSYGSSIGDSNYNPDADLHPQPDGDGDVDYDDYILFLEYWLNLTTPSSAVEWPAIYITPSSIIETGLTPTKNFIVTIETDYNGSDIWGWELTLTYNPLVLEGVAVVNGNITQAHPAVFSAGTFDNNAGKLSLTGAYFKFETNATGVVKPVNVTNGPGILANVTFKVVGTGDTPITLGIETKLIGWSQDGSGDVYNIVDARLMPYHIGHGYFRNTAYDVVHDAAVLSGSVNDTKPYGEGYRNVSINATVKNEGNVTEKFKVSIYYRFISPDWLIHNETVQLASGATQPISVVWNTLNWFPGTGNLTVVATQVWNETDTADNQLVIDAVHVRILGDVDANGKVDSLDCMLLVGVYPDPTPPPDNPDADIDGDGDIDEDDWMILAGNLGKSE